jgi:hypothetical protein
MNDLVDRDRDRDRSLTLAGATPPFDSQVGQIRLPLGSGITG